MGKEGVDGKRVVEKWTRLDVQEREVQDAKEALLGRLIGVECRFLFGHMSSSARCVIEGFRWKGDEVFVRNLETGKQRHIHPSKLIFY